MLPEISWQTVIVNVVTALPGIIIAIATLVKVVKAKGELEHKTDEIRDQLTAAKNQLNTAVNGGNVLRAPRRSTDPCPEKTSEGRENGTQTGS